MNITFQHGDVTVEVPYTLALLNHFNETLPKINQSSWFPLRKEKKMTETMIEFANVYFPEKFDWDNHHPMLAAFFFRFVRDTLYSSIDDYQKSISSTDDSMSDTVEKKVSQA